MTSTLNDSELLARLVGFDTTSRNSNLPLADFVCDYLDRPGIEVVRNPSPDGEKANLVIFVGPEVEKGERQGLMLSGHMDVVPAEEPGWEGSPFTLRETEDRFIGRGSADMKGFLALAINRAARAAEGGLRHPLALVFTYDEEVGTLGARHLARTWESQNAEQPRPLPRHGIIGEPTSLEVVRLHKGHLKLRVSFQGKGAHSGYPHLGVNAIEPAGRVISALADLRHELEAERPELHELFPDVPFVALNVGQVQGGTAVNIVPEQCLVDLGGRVLPAMASKELETRVRQRVAEAAGDSPYTIEVLSDSPPLLLEDDAPICRFLSSLVSQEQTVSASYATDAGWIQHMGVQCAVWGPGSIEVAHKPEEFMPKDEFAHGGNLLDQAIDHFCRQPG